MAISDDLLDAILHQESGGDPNALNKRTGAAGIAQIMEATAKDPGFGVDPISPKDRFDPKKAVPFARSYLNALSKRYKGNVANTLAAYNWGPGNVDKWLKSGATFDRLPDETRNYVVNILGNRGNAPPQPEVRGFLRRELDGGTGDDFLDGGTGDDNLKDAITAQKSILAQQTALAARQKSEATARQAKRAAALRNIRPGVQARPNLRPAPSGGGRRGSSPKAFTAPAITTPGQDPLAAQQGLIQRLLNPGTEGGLLGPRNLGPTGLLSPTQRRT